MCLTIYLTSITPLYKNNVVVFTITVSEMASKCILHIPCNFSMNSLPLVSFLLYLFLICCFEELNLWLRVESKCNSEILKQCRQTFACYLVKDSPLFFLKFKKWLFYQQTNYQPSFQENETVDIKVLSVFFSFTVCHY